MGVITDRLALVIDAHSAGAVAELRSAAKGADELALSDDRATAASARLAAAKDKESAANARVAVENAKQSGDSRAIAASQNDLVAAQSKYSLSKAESAAAASKLSVAELEAKAATSGLGTAATVGSDALAKLGLKGATVGQQLLDGLGKAGPLIAAALAAKVFEDGIKGFDDLTHSIYTFQGVAGGTAQEASLLVGEMKSLGVEPDAAAKAVARLGAAIGAGKSELATFGVQVATNKDGTTDLVGTFNNLRDAYNATSDAATKDAIAKQLSLRGATALLPLLRANTDEVRQLDAATRARGEVFTQKEIDQGHQLGVATAEMKASVQGVEISLAKGVVPALTDTLGLVKNIADASHALDDAPLKLVEQIAEPGIFALSGLSDSWDKLTGKQHDGAKAAADAKAANDALTASLQQETTDAKNLTDSLTGEVAAENAVRDAKLGVEDAQAAYNDAMAAYGKLLADGAVDQKAVAQAAKELASASEQVTRAQESEQAAQDSLNKAREKASALDLADANNKIALAGDKIGAANAAEQQAKEALDALLGSGTATAGQIAAAEADYKTKHDEATQAVIDEGKANKDLAVLKQKGTEQDPAVISAERNVANAHDGVTTAISNQADAEQKLRDAETPDPAYQDNLARAYRGVERASAGIADAHNNQITAALGLSAATDKLNASLAGSAAAFDDVLAKINELKSAGLSVDQILALLGPVGPAGTAAAASGSTQLPQATGDVSSDPLLGSPLPARATGGPTSANTSYLVGEQGPEILHMGSRGGYIQPNVKTSAVAPPVVQLTQVFPGFDPRTVAVEAAREGAYSLRRTIVPRLPDHTT